MVKSKIFFVAIIIIILGILVVGLRDRNEGYYKSKELLKKYDYHIDKSLGTNTVKLQKEDPRGGFDLILRASEKINMPFDEYVNEELRAETYRLKEKSQFDIFGEIDATILFNKNNEIVGAYLNVKGYFPSILALNERYFLEPKPKLNPEKLNLSNIFEITISCPWDYDTRRYADKKVLKDKNNIDNFLDIINKSTSIEEEFTNKDISNTNRYRVWFEYNNGAIVAARIYIHEDFNKMKIDNLINWSYDPSQELVDFINSVFQ